MDKRADRDAALLLDVVWRVVTEHLDPLIASLEPLIGQESSPDA